MKNLIILKNTTRMIFCPKGKQISQLKHKKNELLPLVTFLKISLLLLLFILIIPAKSQNLTTTFVKQNIEQDVGTIVFNVVKINNNSNNDIRIKPIMLIPEGWAIFNTSFVDTLIKANETISLPFRIRIPQYAGSYIDHEMKFQIFSQSNQLISQSIFRINTTPFHDWNVNVPKERIIFYPNTNRTEFELNVSNKGNVPENINLNILPDRKIKLFTSDGLDAPTSIYLKPGTDTTVKVFVEYTYTEDRIFDLSKIQIHASVGDKKIYRGIILEKYSDNYNPFEIDHTLPHQVEVGIRNFKNNTDILPYVKTNGKATFSNESSFKYNFTYYDLTQTEDIIGNSYYNFLYTNKELKVGLGAFSSMLGRNLYNRNSIMVADKIKVSKSGTVEGFASYGYFEPKSSAAFGYIHETNKLKMNSSISYDIDNYRKINTASFLFRTNQISIAKNHDLSAVLYAYNELHYETNKYTLSGVAWDLTYFGQLSKKLSLQLTNNYGTPNIPGNQMGLLNFSAKVNLKTNIRKRFFSFKYVNTTKDYYYMSFEGFKRPNIVLHDQYSRILYHSYSGKGHRWSAGPSVEFYSSVKPIINSDEEIVYSVRKYRMEYRSFIGTKLMLSIKAGVGDFYYKETEEIEALNYDFHLLGDYNLGGYGIKLTYDYGPMVNTGIYQYALDASNNSINISPYAIKHFFKDRVSLTLFSNFSYKFDLKYASINVNPKIETYLFKDWYAVIGGTYSYVRQQFKGNTLDASYYYTEFAIKKKWGKSDYKKWQRDLRRVKIFFFQDNNSNGIKDNFEKGIPYVKARLLLKNSADQKRTAEFPTDLTLLSNDKGYVTFSRIPMGFYELTITPLTDQKEYFYISKTAENIEVTKTDVYYIPFQKASIIKGKINVNYRKFTQKKEQHSNLANVKVTAYNNKGNSYSSFTQADGTFVIYAPGNNTYFLRISNVFGEDFQIIRNDLKIELPSTLLVVFNVVEKNRQIKFKSVKKKEDEIQKPQKIIVLPGKIYENEEDRIAEQSSLPEFNIKNQPAGQQIILDNKYYVVLNQASDLEKAKEYVKIYKESGVLSRIGFDDKSDTILIFTNYYSTKKEAKKEIEKLEASGIKKTEIYFTENLVPKD